MFVLLQLDECQGLLLQGGVDLGEREGGREGGREEGGQVPNDKCGGKER